MMRRTPRERSRVSTQQSDRTDTVRSPLRPPLRSRPARLLRLAVADVLRAPRGIEPIERHAFSRILALWVTARALNLTILLGFFVIARAARWGFGPDEPHVRKFLGFLPGRAADRYGMIRSEDHKSDLPSPLLH